MLGQPARLAVWFLMAGVMFVPDAADAQPEPQRPQGQIPDRGRPTERGDDIPLFDYDAYFPGTWQFEWRVPESPLGAGGLIEGTEVFAPGHDGRYYTSRIDARGPDGPFTAESRIIYLAEQKAFTRYEVDSRGFEVFKAGRIGGDLGGFYTVHYETPPFGVDGRLVQLRMTTRLVSPVNYRVESSISIDAGPFTSYGTAWWTKHVPSVTESR
ncbi:MAG: hypothetical protein O3A25_12520 [Acidobacteria bacterium]|nr:hypothetical protein [Acidobacteriota bacterium]